MSPDIFYQITLIISMSVIIDTLAGEPPNKIHPVVLIGKIIGFFTKTIKTISENNTRARITNKRFFEKINGVFFAVILTLSIGSISYIVIYQSLHILGPIAFLIISIILLKITFSIKSMDKHIYEILNEIEKKNINMARNNLSKIVSRNTKYLSQQYILSACVECIAESFVDSISSPLFYYGILNIPGAMMYRVINTLDSMIGYRDDYYLNIGWMSAKLDTFLNAIPARISVIFLIGAIIICRQDWRNSILIMKRDRKNTSSYNAGIPMSIMAGALNIQLEKIDNYKLGDMKSELNIQKCKLSLKITKIATFLYIVCFIFPVVFALYYVNWWSIFFGL